MSAPASPANGMHAPCCSAHGVDMTCERYRCTHFVEVRPCCTADAEALMDLVDDTLDGDFVDQSPEPGHPFGSILDGTAAAPRTAFPRSGPEHLRTDDMPSYLRQKGELA